MVPNVFKRVLALARRCEHFFDLSGDQRVHWMVERAYRMGRSDAARRARRGRVPSSARHRLHQMLNGGCK